MLRRSYDLLAGSSVNLLVLFYGYLFQCVHLAILGLYSRTVDDYQRISLFHPLAFFNQEGVDASRQFAADANLGSFGLPLQDERLVAHGNHSDDGEECYCHKYNDECDT